MTDDNENVNALPILLKRNFPLAFLSCGGGGGWWWWGCTSRIILVWKYVTVQNICISGFQPIVSN